MSDELRRAVDLAPNTLGEALRLLRHRTRVSRDALAGMAGVSAGAISNYENDVSAPSASTLRRICGSLAGTLDVSVGEVWEQIGVVLDGVGVASQLTDHDADKRMVR